MSSENSWNVKLLLLTLLGLAIGALIFIGIESSSLSQVWKTFWSQIVSVILIAGVLNYVWDIYSKEKLKQEILGTKSFNEEINHAGLVQIPSLEGFKDEINWDKYFTEVKQLDLFVSYAYSWRQNNRANLEKLAERENAIANIILPDYNNDKIVSQLANWFNIDDEEELREKIKKAAHDFYEIFNDNKIDYTIYLTEVTPVYSFYRFDHMGIMSPYKHRAKKSGIPSFVFKRPGSFYDFISHDFEFLIKNSDKFEPNKDGEPAN